MAGDNIHHSAVAPAAHSLSQVQIIRALADALEWLEKELSWSVKPQSLKHLTGRIGELYAAMITRGQMALSAHQPGYDVVSAEGERISVKTVTTSTHVSFNKNSMSLVDRVMILRLSLEGTEASIEEIFDGSRQALEQKCGGSGANWHFLIPKPALAKPLDHLRVTARGQHGEATVIQYENGTVIVRINGKRQPSAMAVLLMIAKEIGVSPLNGNGNPRNTRQLGAAVIAALNTSALRAEDAAVKAHAPRATAFSR